MGNRAHRHRASQDKAASFGELFFDLVFVYSVTQEVGLLHGQLAARTVGQAVLVFWLVWWAWTQFTWALNAADADHPLVRLAVLGATVVAFLMAVALPDAFGASGVEFAASYVLVRGVGLAVYAWVAWSDGGQRAAVCLFTGASLLGLGAVLVGGFLGGDAQLACWGVAVALDVLAALVGGRAEGWNLFPEHFAERHGLFVIIALGETLIVAANGAGREGWRGAAFGVATLAVATTCALWWTYFGRAKAALARALERRPRAAQARLARDAYSLLHFPMLLGVIAIAVALEHALAHPSAALGTTSAALLGLGLALFVGGMGVALRLAEGTWPAPRLVLGVLGAGGVAACGGLPAPCGLGATFALCLAVALAEERRASGEAREAHA